MLGDAEWNAETGEIRRECISQGKHLTVENGRLAIGGNEKDNHIVVDRGVGGQEVLCVALGNCTLTFMLCFTPSHTEPSPPDVEFACHSRLQTPP